jgi:two-component system OmpR family sensor kinase
MDPPESVGARRWTWLPAIPGLTARFRILLWCSLLVAVALATSIIATRIVLLQHASTEIDSELSHELDEAGKIELGRIDPQTKKPFVDGDEALTVALDRAAPNRSQELLAISDGRVIGRTPSHPIAALESSPQLVKRWALVKRPTYGTVQTANGPVRFLAAPIASSALAHSSNDVFVAATFTAGDLATVNSAVAIAATVGTVALVVAILLAWLIAGRILAPVRALERAARSITDSDLSYRLDVRGDDELARLANDFNSMLDRVEAAFLSQRQFLDDASHELRTPITVIRGHVELLGDDPAERVEVSGIIIDELDRMSRMVSDLLLIAQARMPDFLRLGPVDCANLTAEVRAKAAALASDRVWVDGGHADNQIIADRQRLTQAWMQLAQNAVQHTSPGDIIELGSRSSAQDLYFWVADSGPGVAPGDREAIFHGFARAADAPRTGQHFGLGLPIVRGIVEAHRGQVLVNSSNYGGALFTMKVQLREDLPWTTR